MQEVEPVLEVREALDGVQVLVELRVQRGAQVDEHVDPVERERSSRAAQRRTGDWRRKSDEQTGSVMYCTVYTVQCTVTISDCSFVRYYVLVLD